jgi:hypothetical protein
MASIEALERHIQSPLHAPSVPPYLHHTDDHVDVHKDANDDVSNFDRLQFEDSQFDPIKFDTLQRQFLYEDIMTRNDDDYDVGAPAGLLPQPAPVLTAEMDAVSTTASANNGSKSTNSQRNVPKFSFTKLQTPNFAAALGEGYGQGSGGPGDGYHDGNDALSSPSMSIDKKGVFQKPGDFKKYSKAFENL